MTIFQYSNTQEQSCPLVLRYFTIIRVRINYKLFEHYVNKMARLFSQNQEIDIL